MAAICWQTQAKEDVEKCVGGGIVKGVERRKQHAQRTDSWLLPAEDEIGVVLGHR